MTGRVLVAHAAWVERAFLGRLLRTRGARLRGAVIDTSVLGRLWLAERDGRAPATLSLTALAAALGLPIHRPHRAAGDALTTAQAFIALAALLGDETVRSLADARASARGPRWAQPTDEFSGGRRLTGRNPTRRTTMSKVYTGASMSLDGYVSGPNETGFEHLFKWYGTGDVEVTTADPNMTMRMTAEHAEHWRAVTGDDRRAGRGAQAVRLHQRLGRQAPDRRAGRGADAQRAGRLGARGRVVHVRLRRHRGRDREGARAGGRQGGRAQLGHDREPGPRTPGCSTRSGSTSCPSCSAAAPRSSRG